MRRAVQKLENQMRFSLSAVVERENRKSLSPAWRERDFLLRVFQRVDKKTHGRYTGDCDLAMFMQVWGAPPPPVVEPTAATATITSTAKEGKGAAAQPALAPAATTAGDLPEPAASPKVAAVAGTKRVSIEEPSLAGLTLASSGPTLVDKKKKDDKFEMVKLLEEVTRTAPDGTVLRTNRKVGIPQAAAAAVFVKYGYDREGYMPYEVFIKALLASPSRLLGMEPIMDAKEAGPRLTQH